MILIVQNAHPRSKWLACSFVANRFIFTLFFCIFTPNSPHLIRTFASSLSERQIKRHFGTSVLQCKSRSFYFQLHTKYFFFFKRINNNSVYLVGSFSFSFFCIYGCKFSLMKLFCVHSHTHTRMHIHHILIFFVGISFSSE